VAAALCASAQRFSFESYDQRSGLKNANVRCMLQDKTGLLWFGTEAGLFRYDGYRFEQMTVPDANGAVFVIGLVEDGEGRVWFSTTDALGYFENPEAPAVIASNRDFAFDLRHQLSADPDHPNRIYFVSRNALYQASAGANRQLEVTPAFSVAQIVAHPDLAQIFGIVALPGGQLWAGCGSGICSIHDKAFRVYSAKDGLPEEPWLQLFVDRKHTLWARSEHQLVQFQGETGRFSTPGDALSAATLSVREPHIAEDPQGRVLINLSSGLARYDAGTWSLFRKSIDLPTYLPTAMLTDRQGSIWLGLTGHGAARWLGYNQWESLSTANGLSSNAVWNLVRDPKGDLWIATESDLDRMKHSTGKVEVQKDSSGAPMQRIQALYAAPDGHIWSGSDNGKVIDYDPVTRHARLVAQLGGIFHFLPHDDGQIWICSLKGLYSVDTSRKEDAHLQPAPAPQGRIFQGARDASGAYWFIADSGLYRLADSRWTHIRLATSYRPAFSAQIAVARDQTLWLSGATPALIHIQIAGDTARELERFELPPLSSGAGTVYVVRTDRRGWIWVGTDDGLNVYNGSQWRHLDADDGLVWNDTDSNAFLDDNDGSIWIGTSGGAAHILHPDSVFRSEPLTVYLSHVSIGSTVLTPDSSTTLAWTPQPFTAYLSTLDFAHARKVTFRYHVEGINEDWQDSTKHDLRYPPLAPGHYRLAVVAVDKLNSRHSPAAYVSFLITPPWWRSNAMHAAEGLCAILLIVALWRWSMRRHLANERHLQELVLHRTNELELEKAELLKTRAALQEQATHDSLTGLLNHGAILQALELAMRRSLREKTTLGIVLADLDYFKRINDTYGHLTGDLILQEYSRRTRAAIRPYDEVGRYGGEEILIILPGFPQEDAMSRLADLHSAICEMPFYCKENNIHVTCSFGFAWFTPGVDSIESLVERADRAMYAAKDNGRNRIEICEYDSSQPVSPIPA